MGRIFRLVHMHRPGLSLSTLCHFTRSLNFRCRMSLSYIVNLLMSATERYVQVLYWGHVGAINKMLMTTQTKRNGRSHAAPVEMPLDQLLSL